MNYTNNISDNKVSCIFAHHLYFCIFLWWRILILSAKIYNKHKCFSRVINVNWSCAQCTQESGDIPDAACTPRYIWWILIALLLAFMVCHNFFSVCRVHEPLRASKQAFHIDVVSAFLLVFSTSQQRSSRLWIQH